MAARPKTMENAAKEILVRNFKIQTNDIVFIKAVLESYEGMVVVRTIEIGKPVIELLIARDFAETVDRVIRELQGQLPMEEVEVSPGAAPSWP